MEGYVYILTNAAMPGLLKIGSTRRSPEERKRELSKPTGVPIDFNVEYEIFSSEMKYLEDYIHDCLAVYRFNNGREFFKCDLVDVIEMVRAKAEEIRLASEFQSKGVNELSDSYEAIEVLGKLQMTYPDMIRSEIKSVRIYQTKLRCYIEVTEEQFYNDYPIPLIDQKIHRQDLGFITGGRGFSGLFFDPKLPVSRNARVFIEDFDDYSKLNCCSELFTVNGCDKIWNAYSSRK